MIHAPLLRNECNTLYFTRPRNGGMTAFDDLPPEVILQICTYLPHRSLVHLCATSKSLHALTLPLLYTSLVPGSLTGCLRLFRQLAKGNVGNSSSNSSYISTYAPLVESISMPKIPATHEVKAAIALALSQCIENGSLPALKELKWPFTFVRRGFLEEINACRFDEPLWRALADTYHELYVS